MTKSYFKLCKTFIIFLFLFIYNVSFSQNVIIDSLKNEISNSNETDKVRSLVLLSEVYKHDSTELSKQYANQALNISKKLNNDTLLVSSLNQIGTIQLVENKNNEALKTYFEALMISNKSNYKQGNAITYNHLGSYYNKVNILDSALYFYKKSVNAFEEINDLKRLASTCNNVGIIYYKQVHYDKSLEYFLKALETKEKILPNGKRVATDSELAASYINVGLFYYKLEKYRKALEHLLKAEKMSINAEKNNYTCMAEVNLGVIYNIIEKYDSAMYYHDKAMILAEKMQSKTLLSQTYTGKANVYKNINDYKSSIKYFKKSLTLHKELKDKRGESIVVKNMTELYLKQNNLQMAEIYAKQSLQLALISNNIKVKKEIYEILANINEKTKNYEAAFMYKNLYISINDSINELNNDKIIAEIQTKYETEKKNVEIKELKIEKLEDENTQKTFRIIIGGLLLFAILLIIFFVHRIKINKALNDKNIQLKQLNNTQNRLMSIISHDFKAPLSAFYSITNSLKTKFDKIERSEIDNYFNRMLNSSVALKLQLENMLNWAINQSREIKVSKKDINLHIVTFKVVMILQEFAKEKSITIKNIIPEDIEINTDGKLLSIVLNNLIANAVKFSNPQSEIIVSGKKENGKLILSIKDFGIGMNKTDASNLFSDVSKVSDNENSGTGLGLIVSKDIIEKLDGKIWVESELNVGTKILIEL